MRNWHGTAGSHAFVDHADAPESVNPDFPHEIPAEVRANPDAMLRELLRRFTIATAGREGFDRLQSLRVEGEIRLPEGHVYPYVLSKRAPNRVRLQMSQQGLRIIHGYDGVNSWRSVERMGEVIEVKAIPVEEMESFIRHADITPELHNYERKGWTMRYAGKVDWNGHSTYKIEGSRAGRHTNFYIDASSYLEIGRESWLADSPDEREVTRYYDFERTDGFHFAMKVEHFQDGKQVQSLSIDKIEINPGILNHLFSRPGVR